MDCPPAIGVDRFLGHPNRVHAPGRGLSAAEESIAIKRTLTDLT